MKQAEIGVIGLGVMGSSLSLNFASKGFNVSVYNRLIPEEKHVLDNFSNRIEEGMSVNIFTDLEDFVASLERPRKILMMIKAGSAIDAVTEVLLPFLSEGDVLIDGGNSHYLDTNRRVAVLKQKNIHFMGCGISGGESGALKGPSIMPGGTKDNYKHLAPFLEAIAAKDKQGLACCTHIGPEGSGHFVKMIHNGIEYAEMQLLAELYGLLSTSKTNEDIAQIFKTWNTTYLNSYLLEITIDILEKKENEVYVLDTILDKAGNKGTGSWSAKTAFNLGTVNTMMSAAVFARYISSFKSRRVAMSKRIYKNIESNESFDIDMLERAYRFARIINQHQGFELIKEASNTYNWDLNLSEIARIWTNGCIIRSKFMEDSITVFKVHDNYLDSKSILEQLISDEPAIKQSIMLSMLNRVAFDTFWAAYSYWVAMSSKKLPANLIQAQRDYFGAHTYERVDAPEGQFFHTNWYSS
ncbi:NADP-dependent phosphogluconate dehydrogenase [Hyunsoonleella ulvae]|uniref:NADP-dependent phosphogluconate dehydrogenase n=1 Tax=Hyunsoonleella ulvae TaxID=2799948 RepID=UPI0019392710|nr:NADP-dependent phosphogluconate dehydrogenase [Hyunsoonleella ulvae]